MKPISLFTNLIKTGWFAYLFNIFAVVQDQKLRKANGKQNERVKAVERG